MSKTYQNVLELIGNTPLVKLNHCVPRSQHTYWAKVEYFNPGGSVKDRIGLAIIEEAEKRGDLKPGGTIIEATSGNTGVGLALVAAVRGYKCIFVMPEKMSGEKVNLLRAYGAKVVITPSGVEPDDPRSHYSVAKKLVEITPHSFYANQYHTADNFKKHLATTGPEIWEQTDGKINALVGGAGTGGTISGCARYLKSKNPNVKIILADPIGSILYDLYYHKEVRTPPAPYKVEGIGEDMLPDNVHFDFMDAVIQVNDLETFTKCREILKKEGLFVGPSAGTALAAAIKYGEKTKEPQNIVVIFPDSGDRYLSKAFNEAWLKDNGLLDSPLQQKTIADLMSKTKKQGLITVQNSDQLMDVIKIFHDKGISQVPVMAENKLVGVIEESDLVYPLASGLVKTTDAVLNLIKPNFTIIEMTDSIQKLSDSLAKNQSVFVYDQNKKLQILTKMDLIEYLGQGI